MSNLLKSSQTCTQCGSKRGLAIYSDNEHCFSCGYHRTKYKTIMITETKPTLKLPDQGIPTKAFYDYVAKYKLPTNSSLTRLPAVYYNDYYNSAIFRIYDLNGKLMAYQARRLDNLEPKWVTISSEEDRKFKYPFIAPLHFVKPNPTVIIVEDIVSAYVLAHYGYPVISILGCKANKALINFLSLLAEDFIVWLDGDKAGMKGADILCKQLALITKSVRRVQTELDPKEYSGSEIYGIL